MIRLLVLLVVVSCAAPAPRMPTNPAYDRIDTFGSAVLDRETLLARHGPELVALVDEPFDPDRMARVKHAIETAGSFALVELSIITYYQPQRSFLTVDLVDAKDRARRMTFSPAPTAVLSDPDGLLAAFDAYQTTFFELLKANELPAGTPECGSAWHCLGFHHARLAAYEPQFDAGVPQHEAELAAILREDVSSKHRAYAAFLLAHIASGPRVVELMLPAIRDPESLVRNNAMRVLVEIARVHPEIAIPVQPIIEALDFPTTTDRNKASALLSFLAKHPENRAAIRTGAGKTLVAMLGLHQPNNHDFAYAILKEISGKDLGEHDVAAWTAWLR